MSRIIPIIVRIVLLIMFWNKNAEPVRAINAQTRSPIMEPNWINKAEENPLANPLRIVSAVTTPGGAQYAIPNKSAE